MMMVEVIDFEDELFVFNVVCQSHEEWEDSKAFHIVTEEGYEESFYCPICDAEGKRIRSTYIQDEHKITLLGKLTFEEIIRCLESTVRKAE